MSSNKTVVVACRCYKETAEKFKTFCRKLDKFHADVLRQLIIRWNKEQEKNGLTTQPIVEDIDEST